MPELKSILTLVASKPNIRYGNLGDWYDPNNGNRLVVVADLPDSDMRLALAIHEIVEQHLCIKNGVPADAVDKWDAGYTGDGDPGSEPQAPYFKEHIAALIVEHAVCDALGIKWGRYEEALDKAYAE